VFFITSKFRSVLGAVICGVLVSLATGLYEGDIVSILEVRYYGYPLVWRITNLNGPTEYVLTHLAIDAMVWVTVSLMALFILQRVGAHLLKTSAIDTAVKEKDVRTFLAYFLILAFVMKAVGEFVHEALGHGLFVVLFGGRIVRVNISLLWPYKLSSIELSGNFEAWQLPWIDGGGILVCLTVSCIIQALLLWKVKNWRIVVPLFWLAFWTFLNPTGYLIIGGIKPFGDISQLIVEGVLSQTSSLVIGLITFALAFFSLSRIFKDIVSNAGFIKNKKQLRVCLSLLWLIIPLITLMAITGLGFLSSFSLLLFAISLCPSIVALLLPGNLPSTLESHSPSEE